MGKSGKHQARNGSRASGLDGGPLGDAASISPALGIGWAPVSSGGPRAVTDAWTGGSGDWSNNANWSTGLAPTLSNDATVAAVGTYTVSLSSDDAANSLTIDAAGATVAETTGGTLTLNGTLDVEAGRLLFTTTDPAGGSVLQGGTISVTGGTVAFETAGLHPISYWSGVTYWGTLALGSTWLDIGTLTVAGSGGSGAGLITLGASGVLDADETQILTNGTLSFGNSNAALQTGIYGQVQGITLTLASSFAITQSGGTNYLVGNVGIGDEIVDNGSIHVSGGTLVVHTLLDMTGMGSFKTSGSGVIQVDNQTGETFGGLTGTIAATGVDFLFAGGLLENAEILGTLSLSVGTAYFQTLTLAGDGGSGAGHIAVNNATFQATATQSLGNGTLSFGPAGGTLYVDNGSSAGVTLTLADNFTITQGAGTSYLQSYGANADEIIDQGTLSVAGGLLDIATTLALTGDTVLSTTGGGEIYVSGGAVLTGTIVATGVNFGFGNGNLADATIWGDLGVGGGNCYFDTLTLAGAHGVGAGTISIASGVNFIADTNQTLSNGTLDFGSSTGADVVSYNTLTLAQNFTVSESSNGTDYLGVQSGGATILDGTLTATQGTLSVLNALTIGAHGVINAVDGGVVETGSGLGISNLSNGTLTAGTYNVGAGSSFNIDISNGPALTTDAATITLSGAGSTILWYVPSTNTIASLDDYLTTITGQGALELLAGRDFTAAGAFTDSGLLMLGGTTFTAASGLSVTASGRLQGSGKVAGAVVDGGSITATSGVLQLAGVVSGGGALVAGTGAVIDMTVASVLSQAISGAGTLQLNAANFGLSGKTIAVADLSVGAGATLTGKGVVGGALLDIGHVVASGGTLTLGAVSGAGTLGAAAGAVLKLTAGGTIAEAVSGGGTILLTGDTPYGLAGTSFTAADLSVASGTALSGSGTIAGATANAGTIAASATTLKLAGAVSGAGTLLIDSGATLELGGAAGAGQVADFAGRGALKLDDAAGFAGGIANLAAADQLILSVSTATGATLSASSLQIVLTGGTGVTYSIIGGTGQERLAISSDGHTLTTYRDAVASLAQTTINLGITHVGSTSVALGLTNSAVADSYSEQLDASFASFTGDAIGAGSVTALAAGASSANGLSVGLASNQSGTFSGTAQLALLTDGTGVDGLAAAAIASQTVTLTGVFDNYAVAAFQESGGASPISGTGTHYTLDLGSVTKGAAALSFGLGVLNAAGGLADLLGGTIATKGAAGFTNSGFGSFSGLAAGKGETAQSVTLSTSTVGTFSETVVLTSAGSNASGYSGALPTETLTITGTVTPVQGTYTLAVGPNVIVGSDGGDVFQAVAGSLNSQDSITGGQGNNVLELLGGGVFDIGAPTVLANLQMVTAEEGEVGTADLPQTVFLRSSTSQTVNVLSGTAASGNANPETITIYDGNDTDTIHLGAGADVLHLGGGTDLVTIGSAKNSIFGGSGNALVQASLANASAAVAGTATGATILEVTTGGTLTLNAADTDITVKLDAATRLTLSKLAFLTADGSNGGDTLIAAGTSQTLIGGTGDILSGFAGGSDTFLGTSAGLNGDRIGSWTTGDVIDLTDMNSATLKALTFSSGKLGVSDGVHSSSIVVQGLTGVTLTAGNFTVLGSDGNGGTVIGFHG